MSTRAHREQDAVAHEAQCGEARDAGEHQVEAHPFLARGDDGPEPGLGADELRREQHDEGMREADAHPANSCGAEAGTITRKKIVRAGVPMLRAVQIRSLLTDSTA